MKKFFFTIIIPVYNSEKFIKKCITSILNQNFFDYEIIIINDCSTDRSSKICQKLKHDNLNKIKLIRNDKNLGAGQSRNLGLKYASGKYIIFLDSDDYLLESILNFLEKNIKKKYYPDVILNHIIQNKNPISNINELKYFSEKKISKNQFLKILFQKDYLPSECWRVVVSSNLIDKNKIVFRKIKIAEDASFIFKVFIYMKNISINKNKFLFHSSRYNSLKYTKGVEPAYAYYTVLMELQEYQKKFKKDQIIMKYLKFKINNIVTNLKVYLSLLNKNQLAILIGKIKKERRNFIFQIIKDMEDKVINSINSKNRSQKKIIIYCAGVMTQSIIKILKKKNINIINIIDDDPIWVGKKLMKIKIKKLSNCNNLNNNKNLIIICNHSKKVIENIRIKLFKLKLSNKQILSLSF